MGKSKKRVREPMLEETKQKLRDAYKMRMGLKAKPRAKDLRDELADYYGFTK